MNFLSILGDFTNCCDPIIIIHDTPIPSPLDMQGTQFKRIKANATDDETIVSVKIRYRFSEEDNWNISKMSLDLAADYYYFDVLVPTENGSLTFTIAVADILSLTSETDFYMINFENAKVTSPASSIDPLLVITTLLGLSAG
ncbi:MAG: hypothetical protein ACFE95_22810 [Candidatus Hodarchaeota archaeon]